MACLESARAELDFTAFSTVCVPASLFNLKNYRAQDYGLNCSVQIRYDGVAVNMDLDGEQRELESSLLTRMVQKGRYLDFANRAIINFPHVSFLVKNMPVEDESKHCIFTDQLMILLQATESRIGALVSEMQVKKQRAILEKMIGRTKHMLSKTDEGKNWGQNTVFRSRNTLISDLWMK